jgi:hypothetical protein
MKNRKLFAAITAAVMLAVPLLCFTVMSCRQDAIFYAISIDVEPVEPLIGGSPTNIITVGDNIYAATRWGKKIYQFNGHGWSQIAGPGGNVYELASDGTDLFALVFPGGDPLKSAEVRKYNAGAWTHIPNDSRYLIHTIYGAGGKIFAGGQERGDYRKFGILCYYCGSFNVIKSGTSLLRGAAAGAAPNDIYLATSGSGIFKYDSGANSIDEGFVSGIESQNQNVLGIIASGGYITAVSSNGNILISDSPVTGFTAYPQGVVFTGAMCVWKDYAVEDPVPSWKPKLLLLGIQDEGSYTTHGYREVLIGDDGKPSSVVKIPGSTAGTPIPSSVSNEDKYEVSIGKHPVMSILQVPPDFIPEYASYDPTAWEPPIFASTQKDGLWSYRDGQWNAED